MAELSQQDAILRALSENPEATPREIAQIVQDRWGIAITASQVSQVRWAIHVGKLKLPTDQG